jgi:predicted transcriptional regulator
MEHRGEKVEAVVRRHGFSLTKLADLLGVTRKTVYNKFNEANLSYDFILKVGHVLKYDFREDFPKMFNPNEIVSALPNSPENNDEIEESLHDYRRRLIKLQAEYIELLKAHNTLLMHMNQIEKINKV